MTLKGEDALTARDWESWDQVRLNPQARLGPGEAQPPAPAVPSLQSSALLISNRWVSQTPPQITSSFLTFTMLQFSQKKTCRWLTFPKQPLLRELRAAPAAESFARRRMQIFVRAWSPVDAAIPWASSGAPAQISFTVRTDYGTHRHE